MVTNQLLDFEVLMQLQKNKLTGSFFTPEIVGKKLAQNIVLKQLSIKQSKLTLSICDPFCGDGRLVCWLIEELAKNAIKPNLKIDLWDLNSKFVSKAKENVKHVCETNDIKCEINGLMTDTFVYARVTKELFDIVITNPPWFILKPDPRHTASLTNNEKLSYSSHIKEYSQKLSSLYAHSIAPVGWGGWNINFARVGVEVSLSIAKKDGICGIISPESLLADTKSKMFRKWILGKYSLVQVSHYPAESKLFDKVDQSFITILVTSYSKNLPTQFISYDKHCNCLHDYTFKLTKQFLNRIDLRIPVNYSKEQIILLQKISKADDFTKLSKFSKNKFWIGRELDETRYKDKLSKDGTIQFLKGKDIIAENLKYAHSGLIDSKECTKLFESMKYYRLVWRDVSRPTQMRRIQSTLIPPGPMAGNSLNILHTYSSKMDSLYPIYGIFSSLIFEFQARALLATNHISSGAIKLCKIPKYESKLNNLIKNRVQAFFEGNENAKYEYNITLALAYGLSYNEYSCVVNSFKKLPNKEKYLDASIWKSVGDKFDK